MAGSFLPKPEGMAGLLRPFIKMNYESVCLSGSIWPRLGGGGPAGPLPAQHKTLFLSSPPRLLPTLPCTPCPCLMKEKGIDPSRESPELEVEFNLRKLFSYKWQAPGWPGLARALGDLYGPLSRPPPLLQAISKSTQPGGRGAGWGRAAQPQS